MKPVEGRCLLAGSCLVVAAAILALGVPGFAADPPHQPRSTTRLAIEQAPAMPGWTGDPRTLVPPVIVEGTGQAQTMPPAYLSQDLGEQARTGTDRLVAAATESGLDRLQRKIEAQHLTPEMTVGELLGGLPAGSRAQLRAMLASAPQVGGPRFPVPGTAEVQLQIRGSEVADFLLGLSAEAGEAAPMPAAELERRLRAVRGITFHATGGSAASDVALDLRLPPEKMPPSWRGVTEENRRLTVVQAQNDAVNRLITLVRPIRVLEDIQDPNASAESTGANQASRPAPPRPLTLEAVLKRGQGSVEAEVREYLSAQPYSTVQYGEGRSVEVRLAVEPADWLEQLRVSMSNPDLGLPAIPEEQWERFKGEFSTLLNTTDCEAVTGMAVAPDSLENPIALALPQRPPEWTRLPLTAQATAKFDKDAAERGRRRLIAGGEARQAARQELRQRLDALVIGETQTLGQIAQANPAVAAALDTAAANATVTRTNYGLDSVTVHVSLNPAGLWQTLQRYGGDGPSRGQVAPPPGTD